MIIEQVKKVTVRIPVDHLGFGVLPCGKYNVAKQVIIERGMRFIGYLLYANEAFDGECLILAGQMDALAKEGKIIIEWGL